MFPFASPQNSRMRTASLVAQLARKKITMELGNFSLSLVVKDIAASRAFYEKLGFERIDGVPEQGWLILKNGAAIIGLFHGMFEKNMLTFQPPDVRAIQRELKAAGITLTKEADESKTGTDSLSLIDPDGNPILMDQPMTPEERAAWDAKSGGEQN